MLTRCARVHWSRRRVPMFQDTYNRTQGVRVRACRNPQRGKEEMGLVFLSRPTCCPWYKLEQYIQKPRTRNTHAIYFVLDHPVSMSDKIKCTNTPTEHAQWTLTHSASCSFQRMKRHQGVRSQRRGRRCRRRSGTVDNTLTAITQTQQTNRTKHALNAGHRGATSCGHHAS